MTAFEKFIEQQNVVLMPGGSGTELQRRGFKTTLPLWSARANTEAYDLLTQIHADYFQAGADICVTNTYRSTPYTYLKAGRTVQDAHESLKRGIESAREAQKSVTDRPTFIAGSYALLEGTYSPDLVPEETMLEQEHERQAAWLAAENVDYLLAESINAAVEGKYMAKAASKTGLPFIVSLLVDSDGKLLDGSSMQSALELTDYPGRIGVSLNCRPIDVMNKAFDLLQSLYDGLICVYPNGFGHPHPDQGWIFEDNSDTIDKFVAQSLRWQAKGAKIIGGCCGTTPSYIKALSEKLGRE